MNITITAGGTREYIDPVRFISNASSGRMGYALAAAARDAGHSVTLITAPTALQPPDDVTVINVTTSEDMFTAVRSAFPATDCLIMAAAVSDYRPAKTSSTKIKKSDAELTIRLEPTTDILRWAGQNKTTQLIVGFALEDTDLETRAEKKLRDKNADMIIANAPSAISADESALKIKTPNTPWQTLPPAPKQTNAKKIITEIEKLYT
ncbi:DNA/pantothenate metabolism flavoprotein [Anaerohalosphaera lusitana]|uniref:DNA/pantothenate metabolism flavoprotein n=1 Tax=Anaerohalosphaera lusitana TaxID=1936003 RepID=A0A1U9NH10_9BACT|nr:phosphopantothenoylcysteine decarboxylase [Anaerohalosphaera lusitana]AQT67221.1 DNA/pantothenate metabolism flavoprotein [Anaerohalosphaera lusitana]